MTQETNIFSAEVSFKDFLFKNKWNRTILWLAGIALVIQFAVFKYFYPFASFIHGDSFSYINAAYHNLNINTYLIGYSKFLRLFSVFSSSDFALTAFQYILIQCSSFFLLFSTFYFYKPGKATQCILVGIIIFNPLFLHLANLISSDCVFTSISFIWFSLVLWIIHKPDNRIILLQAVTIYIAFTIRYNALIYPIITIIALYFSHHSIIPKLKGLGLSLLLCGSFVFFTSYNYKKLTGHWQYSPFSGWQWANNAMYAYRFVDRTKRKPVPKKYEDLDKRIREYFDSTRDVKKFPAEAILASTFYMWSPGMPLMKYRNDLYKKDTSEFKKWATIGPFYKEYGQLIIKKYPLHFAKYFLWPNASKYYSPPIEFLETYNSGKNQVTPIAKAWFKYKSLNVSTRVNNLKAETLIFYPILSGAMNLIYLFSLLCYLMLNGLKNNILFLKGLKVTTSLWIINAAFTIFASSAALRFQIFPIFIVIIFSLLLIDHLCRIAVSINLNKLAPEEHRIEYHQI